MNTQQKQHELYIQKIRDDIKSGYIDKISSNNTDSDNWAIGWSLIPQEVGMWIKINEKVSAKEFISICRRRGFDKYMRGYLHELIKHVGLC